jgi:hypothetical protein
LRLITAAHIKLDSEYYTNFYKWDKKQLDTFCARDVEAMNVEAEDIQMTALAARYFYRNLIIPSQLFFFCFYLWLQYTFC